MPWAGAALGHIIDTFHFNFLIGTDRSRRVKIPAWAVIVVSGTACAYAAFYLYPTNFVGGGVRSALIRVTDAVALVLPTVNMVGRTARSFVTSEAAGAFRVAVAVSWLVVGAMTAVSFAAGVFPAEKNFCRHIAARNPEKIRRIAVVFLLMSIFLFITVFSNYNIFVARNGLLYMGTPDSIWGHLILRALFR